MTRTVSLCTRRWLPLVAVCCLMTHLLPAAEPDVWKVGLARVNITPEGPVRMSGYASRNKPSEGVLADLYAKALALEDAAGHRAVIVTTDLIGLNADFAEPLCERITAATGLARRDILLTSSHTHTGPVISTANAEMAPNWSAADAEATTAYSRRLADRLLKVVEDAVAHLEPARLGRGTGVATFVMNRREFTERGVRLGVNPRGLVDRSVPCLRIDAPDGTLRGVLFGCAAHNTTLTGRHYQISGDYAGFAQETIERRHPGTIAMFMIGCAGDANPYPRGTAELARLHGASLGNEVCRVLDADTEPIRGPLSTAFGYADLPLGSPPDREVLEAWNKSGRGYQSFVAAKLLAIYARRETPPESYRAPFAVWQFGGDLTLVALSGEVVVDYMRDTERILGPRRLWVAAYANDVYGYLPSARVLEEGGYETRGLYYGGVGTFSPAAEEVVVKKIRQLAKEVGREVLE